MKNNFLKLIEAVKHLEFPQPNAQKKMTTNNSSKGIECDEESLISHKINTSTSRMATIQVREVVKDRVFPKAKFLRSDEIEYSKDPNSWCRKMATWCHIEPKTVPAWWINAQKHFQAELQHQRTSKTNVIKKEFFGKYLLCLLKLTTRIILIISTNYSFEFDTH